MIFYSYFAIGIYLIFIFIRNLVKKEKVNGIVRSALLLIVASIVAILMSSDLYFSTFEYSKYSIRGASPIVQTSKDKSQTGGGLDYQYATNWSFGPQELTTFFIPSFYGFGDITYNGPLSNNQEIQTNTYFGPEPFTDAPEYMGVIVLVLAVIGFMRNRRNPMVIFSVILIIVALLISFGREFPLVYNLMFNYFPYFNKFRNPNMILVLVKIFVPVLAAFGVDAISKARENSDAALAKKMLVWTGIFGGLLVLTLVLQGSLQDFYRGVIHDAGRQFTDAGFSIVFDNMIGDLYISLFICLLTTGVIYFYLQRRITSVVGFGALTVILFFDLWRVDYKPMRYSDRQVQAEEFATPDYVQFIKHDTGLYRVLQLENGAAATSNNLAYYFLQGANGYSGAKLRIYQDMIEVVGLSNPNVERLLGVKYVITNKPDPTQGRVVFSGSQIVEENDNALPRAFFVDGYKVADGLQILNSLKDGTFDPRKTVFFESDPRLTTEAPDTNASVQVVDYKIQSMKLLAHASGNNLLLLGEVYYPAGWHAYIDGRPTQIYKADYFLRAVLVPKGVHEIEFKFEPRVYSIGKSLSLASNIVVIVLMVAALSGAILKRRGKQQQQVQNSSK